MAVTWIGWVFPVVVMVTVIPCEGLTTCEKISACSCRSEDGVIDLSPIDQQGTPRFSVVSGYYTYLYNPCTPFTSDQCTNVAVAESDPIAMSCRDIGEHSTSEFVTDSGGLTIKMQDGLLQITSLVKLVCDPNQEGDFRLVNDQYLIYNFQLTSKYACPISTTTKSDVTTSAPTPSPTPSCRYCTVLVMFLLIIVVLLTICLILAIIAWLRKPAAKCQHCRKDMASTDADEKYRRF